ncbi:RNA-binding protein [Candidatus Woesearchaeota archaeon]|nr:RNA-binding protein [Candidatus Woesearchaeota archaeon]
MNSILKCNSCKVSVTNLTGLVRFTCPSCSEKEIVRCSHCREIAARYKCDNCGFSGPN